MSERPLFVAPEPEALPDPTAGWDERRMTLIQHLEELRRVLIVSLICWVVGSVIGSERILGSCIPERMEVMSAIRI